MKPLRRYHPTPSRKQQRGSALIEYTIVTGLAVLVLVSNPNVVAETLNAIKSVYEAFAYSLSTTFPLPNL
ncbi:hypothetical protein FKV24_018340 [Lysobacter maris]|uniref:Uncharacterized protein n=1 Tax=Marilutibacter maris TaxID=1605891 RepID=A0A507ZRK4_9GAMM|nr:hypothetical protein [Lysobacter maris]KAB8162453.1 hypothetical protein FKV24_018340 [Lysobacter maris]